MSAGSGIGIALVAVVGDSSVAIAAIGIGLNGFATLLLATLVATMQR